MQLRRARARRPAWCAPASPPLPRWPRRAPSPPFSRSPARLRDGGERGGERWAFAAEVRDGGSGCTHCLHQAVRWRASLRPGGRLCGRCHRSCRRCARLQHSDKHVVCAQEGGRAAPPSCCSRRIARPAGRLGVPYRSATSAAPSRRRSCSDTHRCARARLDHAAWRAIGGERRVHCPVALPCETTSSSTSMPSAAARA